MDEKGLLEIKERIEEAKAEVSELNGRKAYLAQELQKNWGCKTVGGGQKKVKAMEKEIKSLDSQIQEGIEKLQEEYDV